MARRGVTAGGTLRLEEWMECDNVYVFVNNVIQAVLAQGKCSHGTGDSANHALRARQVSMARW